MRRTTIAVPWIALALVTLLATALRVRFLGVGPDLDVDTYGHATIARAMLTSWRDIRIQWVWLPLWHVVGLGAALAGLDVTLQRWLSIGAAAAAPLLLARILRDRDRDTLAPFIAGAFLAMWPLQVFLGASGEPEATFQVLTLLACLAWERNHPVSAGVALGLAALLRYEAWVLPPVFFALWCSRGRPARGAWAWAIPAALVGAWLVVHRIAIGEWFWFVRENARYVRVARLQFHLDAEHSRAVRAAPFWYAYVIPRDAVGWVLVFALPGLFGVLRRAPRSFTASGLALLALVTAVWVRCGNLGLTRHFMNVVPLYAALVGVGIDVVATAAARAARRPTCAPFVAAALAVVALVSIARGPVRQQWRDRAFHAARAYLAERRVGAIVRANSDGRSRMFCDLPVVEVFSRFPADRVIRWRADFVRDFNLRVEAAQRGHVLVVVAPERVDPTWREMRILYRDERFVVLRRESPAVVTSWLLARPEAR